MSTNDLLSSTTNWPGRGLYGLKSSVMQTTESNLVRQDIVKDHMKNHYRKLNNVRSAIDSKPPKSMILGQKCRDRARKEIAQLSYTQNVLDDFALKNPESFRGSARSRSRNSFVQSQPVTSRARSRSVGSSRQLKRSVTVNGSVDNFQQSSPDLVGKFFKNGTVSQALSTMTAIGKLTSTERNRASGDLLEKHADSFVQPNPDEHKPRLVKTNAKSALEQNRIHYNPPRRTKRVESAEQKAGKSKENVQSQKVKKTPQDELREQLNRSLEIRNDVENKLEKAKRKSNIKLKKQSEATIDKFGLTEEVRLEYVRFMKRLTDEIIRKDFSTEAAIEKLFQLHLSRYGSNLDQGRLNELLEALKQDLGVLSTRQGKDYRTVQQATKFDQNQIRLPINDPHKIEPLILTDRNQPNSSRRSSYDLNDPLPWQNEKVGQPENPTVAPRTVLNQIQRQPSFHHKQDNTSEDEISEPVVQPKPQVQIRRKPDENFSDDEEFSKPIVQPKPRVLVQRKSNENLSDEEEVSEPVVQPKPQVMTRTKLDEDFSDDEEFSKPIAQLKPRVLARKKSDENLSDEEEVSEPVAQPKSQVMTRTKPDQNLHDEDDSDEDQHENMKLHDTDWLS